jgi:DNA-directed RNA polymerase specialized sigma24 family protein
LLLEGDASRSLDQLYARHGLSLYALAYGIVRDSVEADQAVQDSLAELPSHYSPSSPHGVYAWLAARVRSRARGAVRARDWPRREPCGNE